MASERCVSYAASRRVYRVRVISCGGGGVEVELSAAGQRRCQTAMLRPFLSLLTHPLLTHSHSNVAYSEVRSTRRST